MGHRIKKVRYELVRRRATSEPEVNSVQGATASTDLSGMTFVLPSGTIRRHGPCLSRMCTRKIPSHLRNLRDNAQYA
jgi:hypothetical protein